MKSKFVSPEIPREFKLKVGDFVKICVESEDGSPGERFWVRLLTVDGNLLEGVVDNELVCTEMHGIKLGQQLLFERSLVLDVFDGSAEKH